MKIVDVLKQSVSCAKRMSAWAWTLVLFGLFAPFPLYSSVLYVESENSAGVGSLREAIARAGDGDVIQFKVKTVRLTLPIEIPDRFENYGLKIDGGSGKTIIDGGGTSRIFTIRGTGDGKVELSNLIIQNGNDNAVSFDLDIGDSFGPTPGDHSEFRSTVKNCIFENNKGTSGGAIEFRNPNYGSAYLTVESCEFTGNSSSDVGGAIYARINSGGAILITNCEFENNKATGMGGAVFCGPRGSGGWAPTIIRGCRFLSNRANCSGGLYQVRTVVNSTFENNAAATNGACSAQNVCGCTFIGNTASGKTSALELPAGGVLLNSTFVGNSGGQYPVYARYEERGTHWYVCNNVIIGNSPAALGHGGAYSLRSDAGGASMEFYYNTHDCTWESDGYRVGVYEEGDIDSSSADAVFANVRGGIAEGVPVYKDGVRHLRFVVKQNGSADKNGVYVWHDADWANIAYSQTLSGTKTALVGSVDKATTRVQEDACGEQIGNPPNRGACAISASGSSSPTSLPDAPTGVSATDGSYADYARVTWSAASGATSYNLYRSTTSSRPSTATKTGVTSPYNDTTATPGTKYYYWIAAVNSAGSSVSSYDTGYRAVSLTLGKSSDSYLASGGSGSSSVTANTSWSASANVSWISFGTSTGNGNGTVTYTVSANTSASSRTGTITVTAGSGTSYPVAKTIAVSQEAPARTTYTVVFNANGGSGTMENQTIHYCTFEQIGSGGIIFIDNTGENTPLSANAFTKSGYVFSGWSKSPNGAVSFADKAKVTNLAEAGKSITLYAVWAAESDFEIVGGVLTKYKGSGGAVTIPSGVTSIGARAFYDCKLLTSVMIPSGVTSIGDYAFYYCNGLTSVTIPEGVTSIGDYAFYCCNALPSLTLPSSLTSIGKLAFDGCGGLTSLIIPAGVKSFGDYAFCDCSGLKSVTIKKGVTKIGHFQFQDCSELTYVASGSTGWTGVHQGGLPTTWCGKAIAYAPPPPDANNPYDFYPYSPTFRVSSRDKTWKAPMIVTGSPYLTTKTDPTALTGEIYLDDPIYLSFCVDEYWRGESAENLTNLFALTSGGQSLGMWEPGTAFDRACGANGCVVTNDVIAAMQGLPVGDYELTMVINPARNLAETDYSNNETSITFKVVKRPPVKVTLNRNGGSGGTTSLAAVEYLMPMPTIEVPTKSGYVFFGYWTSADWSGEGVQYYAADGSGVRNSDLKSATTLYARWVKTNEVVFLANGGTGVMSALQVKSGVVYKLPPCAFTPPKGLPEGTTFAGWACSNGRRYDDEMLVFGLGGVTMTAIWKEEPKVKGDEYFRQ